MKSHRTTFAVTLHALLALAPWCNGSALAAGADDTRPLTLQISSASILYQPLRCVGSSPPGDAENVTLWTEVQKVKRDGLRPSLQALEDFISAHPTSPWVPSLRANLGRYYEEHGRYTRALQHWEAAWAATRDEQTRPGKSVADFTLAYWTRLLAGLGQLQPLSQVLDQANGRVLTSKNLQQMLNQTRADYLQMRSETDASFRCGTIALNYIGAALKGSAHNPRQFPAEPSPITGFSLAKLCRLAQAAQLDLVAVKWGKEQTPVVPCLVHWKQNHYAAIIREHKGYYEVADPSLGNSRWLTLQDIQDEASGAFLIPRNKLTSGWEVLSPDQANQIYGRGYIVSISDGRDCCSAGGAGGGGGPFGHGGGGPSGPGGQGPWGGRPGGGGPFLPGTGEPGGGAGTSAASAAFDAESLNPSGGTCEGCMLQGGGEDSSSAEGSGCPGECGDAEGSGDSAPSGETAITQGIGMASWQVSEPYINLWLYDAPLGYHAALGKPVVFNLAYKQREGRTIDPNFFSLGEKWNCSWLSFITYEGDYPPFTMVAPGGGERSYSPYGEIEFYSHTLFEEIYDESNNLTGFVVTHPNAARDYYQYLPEKWYEGKKLALLSASVSRQHQTTRFEYDETNNCVFLRRVIDPDGRTNSVFYDNPSFPTQITRISDPFQRTNYLTYDDEGMLTNVTDVAGLSSSVEYDSQGWATKLTTPYGVTTFEYWTNTTGVDEFQGPNYNPYIPTRSVRVVDPVGATNIYLLRQMSDLIYTNAADYFTNSQNGVPFIPSSFDDPSIVPVMYDWPYGSVDNSLLQYRDTFHWGPRQAVGLPSDLSTLSLSDYLKARLRHWSHDQNTSALNLGNSLEMERAPSPDGTTPGQTAWLGYAGGGTFESGESYPILVASVLPDLTVSYVYYLRDNWGRPTNILTSYSSGFGATVLCRTNQLAYDGMNLVNILGPGGQFEAGYAYDANHRLLRVTNALNEVTYFTHDTLGRRTSITTPAGLTTTNIYPSTGSYTNFVWKRIDLEVGRTNTYTYANNLLDTHTDGRGLTRSFTYDALQRLRRIDYPDTTFVTNSYDKLDLARTVDRMGFTNTFGYDNVRRLVARTNALGFYTLYNYCSCGGLESVRDAAGNLTSFSYDVAGRRTQVDYPDNYTVNYYYALTGQITNVTDNAGYSVTNWFNNQGLHYTASNCLGRLNLLAFDLNDRATNSTDLNGVTVSTTYDALGRVRTRTYPDLGVERFGYSARGLTAYTNQEGKVTRYAYDPAGRKTAETNANLEVTQFQYDSSGSLTNLIDAKSQSTRWNYDLYGRVTNKLDNLGTNLFSYSYDTNGRLTNRTSAAKGATGYSYDAVGHLTFINYPSSPDITLQYDPLGRLTNMVDALGTTRYTYNNVGQLLAEDGPWSADTVSYGYENRLRTSLSLLQVNASAWSVSYGHDLAKRLTNITSSAGSFGYNYDATRRALIASLGLPGGAYITNTFDSVARLTGTWLKNSQLSTLNSHQYSYNLANQRTQQVFTAGNYVDYTYDDSGQLKTATGREPGGATVRAQEKLGYSYDAAGNLNWRTNNALLQDFGVNSLNELTTISRQGNLTVAGGVSTTPTSVTVKDNANAAQAATVYGDNTFAREDVPLLDGSNTFTAVAQDSYGRTDTNTVVSYLPASFSCTYDLNGNLLTDGHRSFSYDDENQLVTVIVSNGVSSSTRSDFVYDGKMRRRLRFESTWVSGAWVTNTIVAYVYDGNLVIQERWFTPQISTTIPQQAISYTRGLDLSGTFEGAGGIGGLLARSGALASIASGGGGSPALYHSDGNGNVTCLISTNRVVVARYVYDPYGNILSQTGPLAEANLYRFSTKEAHLNSGLVYYLYRSYDARLQRWVNRDPLSDQGYDLTRHGNTWERWNELNWGPLSDVYLFCKNDPIDFRDAVGLDAYGDCVSRCSEKFTSKQKQTLTAANTLAKWLGCAGAVVGGVANAPDGPKAAIGGAMVVGGGAAVVGWLLPWVLVPIDAAAWLGCAARCGIEHDVPIQGPVYGVPPTHVSR